jgi:peptide deformylase
LIAVNPEVIGGEGESLEEEGCLSVPGYWASVKRTATATLRYQDTDGNVNERSEEGLMEIGMKNEVDHLEGILFVDRLSPLKRSIFRKKFAKMMKEKEAADDKD